MRQGWVGIYSGSITVGGATAHLTAVQNPLWAEKVTSHIVAAHTRSVLGGQWNT